MSGEEVECIYGEEPATTNLNKYFEELDKQKGERVTGKKRSEPEPTSTTAQEEFTETAKKYARYEEKKEDDISSAIRFGTRSMIRGIDIALGYDGSAVKILDDPLTAEGVDMMLVKDSNTREMVRSYKQFFPFVALFGVLLNYHSYRSGWASQMEQKLQTNPEELKQNVQTTVVDDEADKYMKDILEQK